MSALQTLFDNTPVPANFEIDARPLPDSARVVIVGGGIAGAAIAYHFARAGWSDVVLVEQNRVASGTTWHSAGQVGQLRSSATQTKINKASADLYARLKDETGHDPGWLQCGGLQLASCRERMHQLERNAAMAQYYGVAADIVTAEQCSAFWPNLNIDDLVGGIHLPGDGRVLPGECTVALAKGAMQGGVTILENISVSGLIQEERRNGIRRFIGVETNQGPIRCEWVVLAGNMWMRQLGASAGVDIPVYPCEHHYLITRPMENVTRHAPCTRDPDAGTYFRSLDDGSMKLGAFKKRSKPWQIGDEVPNDFSFALLDPDWPDFAEPFQSHQHRLPGLTRDDIVRFINGPEAFTPDNQFIMGQPEMTEGLFVAGGWNSAGIACAGGAGQYTVEWIENGGMTIDLSSVDIRRFLPFQNRREYLQERVSEVLGLHYQMAWPGRQMETARGSRRSAIYDFHAANNACFGNTAGWERPLFYCPDGVRPEIEYSFVCQNWHKWVAEEVADCRNNVALLDQSTFGKLRLAGTDALATLQWLCGRNVDVPVGTAVYTGMFNKGGTFETDLTVVRTAASEFYLVTATSQQRKDFDWISRHIGQRNVTLEDVTDQYNVVSIMGPNAPKVMQSLAPMDYSQDAEEYGWSHRLNLNGVEARAIRISYVGEAGWEFHVAVEDAANLYAMLLKAGAKFGMRCIGNYAISAMRIEKGYRAYGHELSTDDNPFEAGLSWSLDWKKEFLGKDALLQTRRAAKTNGLTKRLAHFMINEPIKSRYAEEANAVLWGNEPIFWNGTIAGYTTSACFSPTLGRNIAMGYVRSPLAQSIGHHDLSQNEFAIQCLGQRRVATASLKPLLETSPIG